MKILPESFTKKGFNFLLELRQKNIAIYKRWKDGQRAHWETVLIRNVSEHSYDVGTTKDGVPRTIKREAGEVYPSSSQWGDLGWTHLSFEGAEKKMGELLEREATR